MIFGGLGTDPEKSVASFEVSTFATETIRTTKPNIVFLHADSDINVEHSIVNQSATYSLTRTEFSEAIVLALEYEVPSSTERNPNAPFAPTLWVPLSSTNLEAKQEAFMEYTYEQEGPPFGRSSQGIRTLAAYRGMQVGASHAEAFRVTRGIAR